MPLCKHLQDFRLLFSVFIVSLLIVNSSSSSLTPPGASYVIPDPDPSTSADPTSMDSLEYGTTPDNQASPDNPMSGGNDPNSNINNGMDQQQQNEYGDPNGQYPEHPENLANPLQADGDLETANTFIIPVFGGYGGWGRGWRGGWGGGGRGGWGGGWRGGWGGGWRGGWGGRWGGWRG